MQKTDFEQIIFCLKGRTVRPVLSRHPWDTYYNVRLIQGCLPFVRMNWLDDR